MVAILGYLKLFNAVFNHLRPKTGNRFLQLTLGTF